MDYYFLILLALINLVTFIIYGLDKRKAKKRKMRYSESFLIGLAVFGGSIGALVAVYTFRHKTKHKKFTIGLPLILIIETALLTIYFGFYYTGV